MKLNICLIIGILFLSIGFVNADTNGVWHLAEDVRSGVFGSDEGGGDYSFMGNVGIGTDSPNAKLELKNGVFLINNTEVGINAALFLDSDNSKWRIDSKGSSSDRPGYFEIREKTLGPIFTIDTSGNVGIGTTNPLAKLDVNGDIKADNIYSNGKIVATKNWVNNNDDVGWYSGNDGSGSGLNADMVDGRHWSDIKNYINNNDDTGSASLGNCHWTDWDIGCAGTNIYSQDISCNNNEVMVASQVRGVRVFNDPDSSVHDSCDIFDPVSISLSVVSSHRYKCCDLVSS